MLIQEGPAQSRALREDSLSADLCVVGGGMAGTCCAITAARLGLKTVLIQDRPVLGGNASSEVRLWTLGATSHMSNNNRWSREGGVLNELLLENLWRNPEGNPILFDTVLLEAATAEPNLTLLLNTACFDVAKAGDDSDRITSVRAFCSQNSTMVRVTAPLFVDASGDGVLGFLSGAAFRIGGEPAEEFDEPFAPDDSYGHLLGHSIYFYSKDVGRPVEFHAPAYALDDLKGEVPRYKNFNTQSFGCKLWWIEYGGRRDTVHETEDIKWELWKIVYGVWDHIKNSGEFPDAQNLTLEWVGTIPGKRESRRFEGDHMLTQSDIIQQRTPDDAVAFGGWSIDLHPADGVYSERKGCNQWHARGVYGIPYRCMYSRNIPNLFLAGRIISASHVAFGSSRVMATCAHAAQAVAGAAAVCRQRGTSPRDLAQGEGLAALQRVLDKSGQALPWARRDPDDLGTAAQITASSTLELTQLPADGSTVSLEKPQAQLLPLPAGPGPIVVVTVDVAQATTLDAQLRFSERPDSFTPDVVPVELAIDLKPGDRQQVRLDFSEATLPRDCYGFVCLMRSEHIRVHSSSARVTGLVAVEQRRGQEPPDDIGVERFEMWTPPRRPAGQNLAIKLEVPLRPFAPGHVACGPDRPTDTANAWVAAPDDPDPTLTLSWDQPQTITRVDLTFDGDWDHALESVLMGHPERAVPFCVRELSIHDADGRTLASEDNNHQALVSLPLDEPTTSDTLTIKLGPTHGNAPASLFAVRVWG
jgi:hypothetical protein